VNNTCPLLKPNRSAGLAGPANKDYQRPLAAAMGPRGGARYFRPGRSRRPHAWAYEDQPSRDREGGVVPSSRCTVQVPSHSELLYNGQSRTVICTWRLA
jgi:hypothetical protein